MKKILLLLLMLVSYKGMSQALIGYTPSQVREKLPNMDWEYYKWGENDKLLVMTFSTEELIVNYFFNDENLSLFCTIKPLKQGGLQFMVEKYNNRYVVINSNTWKFYTDGTVFICRLKTLDDGSFYFQWTEE